MKYIVLVYNDPALVSAIPRAEFNTTMRGCLDKADDMRRSGELVSSAILEDVRTAKSIRVRNGKKTVLDGPFAETKEVLGGFNIVEAENIDEAMKLALEFPWAESGCLEVRAIRDTEEIRRAVSQ